jgi:hypothetical protein
MAIILSILSYNKSEAQVRNKIKKDSTSKIIYTWNGRVVTHKQLRDSLKLIYLKFCDSLKNSDKRTKIE